MDITKLDIKELKVLAYDLLIQAEQVQNDLRIVNQEIQKRTNLNPTIQENESEVN